MEVRGESAEALFVEAALVFCNQVGSTQEIVPRETRVLRLGAQDLPALLLAWLKELRTIFETEGTLFSRLEVELHPPANETEAWTLHAHLWGESFDETRHLRRQEGALSAFDRAEVTPPDPTHPHASRWSARAWESAQTIIAEGCHCGG